MTTAQPVIAVSSIMCSCVWLCYRYILRVVPAYKDTKIDWATVNNAMTGSKVVTRGHFHQLYNNLASQPMKIDCDKPCLVMLYNTGTVAVE